MLNSLPSLLSQRCAPSPFHRHSHVSPNHIHPKCNSLTPRASPVGDPSANNNTLETNSLSHSREQHNALQAEYFTREISNLDNFITDDVQRQLQRIADSVPCLGPHSRVLDCGSGDGALIPHLLSRGVRDILAVDVCPAMIQELKRKIPGTDQCTLGNQPCVRSWTGDIVDLPSYYGPFDAIFFNAAFGNVHDQKQALTHASMILRPGGWIVISHPLGREWLERYAAANPTIVPHKEPLPSKESLEKMVRDLPVEVVSHLDCFSCYIARLKVPDGYAFGSQAIRFKGPVVVGMGRGSRQLGIPTANISLESIGPEILSNVPAGVYFGWAKLDGTDDDVSTDKAVHKMVMNIGRRPTFEDKDPEMSVEVHVMHKYATEDFHGQTMRVVVTGFLRPEMKFNGINELLNRIKTDIGVASSQLDGGMWSPFKNDSYFFADP